MNTETEAAQTRVLGIQRAEKDELLALDIYVGPLTRYYGGDWRNIAQQQAERSGARYTSLRPGGEKPQMSVAEVKGHVQQWQAMLSKIFGCDMSWPEGNELPYWTERPGWKGYEALRSLANEHEHPAIARGEMWLPMIPALHTVSVPSLSGREIRVFSTTDLLDDLRRLNNNIDLEPNTTDPVSGSSATDAVSMFLSLAELAGTHQQPLVLDY